jgi:hypothetical protein
MKALRYLAPYLLAALFLIFGAWHLAGVLRAYDQSIDMLSPWEERMKLVRWALPPGVYSVGYLEGADVPDANADPEKSEFFMTQYGIAPVVLVKGYDHEWILGNFGSALPLKSIKARLDEKLDEYTIQSLGFGLYLIHNPGH